MNLNAQVLIVQPTDEKQASTLKPEPSPREVAPSVSNTMRLTAAGEPDPALRYRLKSEQLFLKEGDVIEGLLRAILAEKRMPNREAIQKSNVDNQERWTTRPYSEDTKKEVREYLNLHAAVLSELHQAANFKSVNADSRFKDLYGVQVYTLTLEELSDFRVMARLIDLEVMLALEEGRLTDALSSIRTGVRLAEAASLRTPTIIGKLVGVAIASMMLERVRDLMQRPDAPNLYWALATFPIASFDMAPAFESEMSFMKRFLHREQPVDAHRDQTSWRNQLVTVLGDISTVGFMTPSTDTGNSTSDIDIAAACLVLVADGPSRQVLENAGTTTEGMSPSEAILRAFDLSFMRYRDQHYKWTLLPASMRGQWLQRAELARAPSTMDLFDPAKTLANLLYPAVIQVDRASTRLQGNLAILATIEAIRMHAAQFGELPETLDALKAVPAWTDPTTSQNFPYKRLTTLTATIKKPSPAPASEMEWILEMQPTTNP